MNFPFRGTTFPFRGVDFPAWVGENTLWFGGEKGKRWGALRGGLRGPRLGAYGLQSGSIVTPGPSGFTVTQTPVSCGPCALAWVWEQSGSMVTPGPVGWMVTHTPSSGGVLAAAVAGSAARAITRLSPRVRDRWFVSVMLCPSCKPIDARSKEILYLSRNHRWPVAHSPLACRRVPVGVSENPRWPVAKCPVRFTLFAQNGFKPSKKGLKAVLSGSVFSVADGLIAVGSRQANGERATGQRWKPVREI